MWTRLTLQILLSLDFSNKLQHGESRPFVWPWGPPSRVPQWHKLHTVNTSGHTSLCKHWPTRSQDQIAHRFTPTDYFWNTSIKKLFLTGHLNGNINNDYFYTFLYICATSPQPFPKANPIPMLSEFLLHRKLIVMD